MKGIISGQFTVFCGLCDEWMYLGAMKLKPAHSEAREKEWRLTKKNGWICPKCAKMFKLKSSPIPATPILKGQDLVGLVDDLKGPDKGGARRERARKLLEEVTGKGV